MPETARDLEEWLRFGGIQEGSIVLELGCGRGAFRYLSEHFRYLGIDLSLEALRCYIQTPSAVQADIGMLPLVSGSADLVFSIAALEHVPHPEVVA